MNTETDHRHLRASEAMASVYGAGRSRRRGHRFEPFYENYGPDAILAGAQPVFVPLEPPDWHFDRDQLRAAFTSRTRAIIVNTPHNPTGRVFTRDELGFIAELCEANDVWAFTDEIYEHIRYAGNHHLLAGFPGMRERTVTISGLSKTFSCTGWRLGHVIAPPDETVAIRKVHDFLTVGAAAPLQQAGVAALSLPDSYYAALAREYTARRDCLLPLLEAAGFRCFQPRGAFYVMTDISGFGFRDDVEFVRHLIEHIGVAAVPGSSFFADPARGAAGRHHEDLEGEAGAGRRARRRRGARNGHRPGERGRRLRGGSDRLRRGDGPSAAGGAA